MLGIQTFIFNLQLYLCSVYYRKNYMINAFHLNATTVFERGKGNISEMCTFLSNWTIIFPCLTYVLLPVTKVKNQKDTSEYL